MTPSLYLFGRRIGLLFSAACLSAAVLAAQDTLVLDNGDTLTGKFLQTTDGNIEFESDVLGKISVAESEATVKTAADVAAEEPAPAPAPTTVQAAITGQAAPEKKKGWLRRLTRMPDSMNGKVSVALTDVSSTADVTSYALSFVLGQKLTNSEWQVYSNYNYGETNGVRNTDNQRHGGWHKWYFYGDGRWFTHLQSSWRQDRIQLIDSEIDVIAGIGYYFLRTPKYNWQLSLGLNYEELNYGTFVSGPVSISIPSEDSLKVGFYEEFTAQPLPYINFTHTFYYAVDTEDQDIYDYILDFSLSTPLTQNTSIGLKYNRTYNSNIPSIFQAGGIENETTTIALQLGYTF